MSTYTDVKRNFGASCNIRAPFLDYIDEVNTSHKYQQHSRCRCSCVDRSRAYERDVLYEQHLDEAHAVQKDSDLRLLGTSNCDPLKSTLSSTVS